MCVYVSVEMVLVKNMMIIRGKEREGTCIYCILFFSFV